MNEAQRLIKSPTFNFESSEFDISILLIVGILRTQELTLLRMILFIMRSTKRLVSIFSGLKAWVF